MNSEMTLRSAAKLNLSLDVTGKLPNGYHAMKMVMCSVSLYDRIGIRLTPGREVRAKCNLHYIPTDERNIACRAARLFLDTVGETQTGAFLTIDKRIPVGAGMAGGSTNAAAVLRGLNELTGAALPAEQLAQLGLQLGSDVPYCLMGGAALAEGQGEILTPLPPVPDCHVLICKPHFPISTATLFARLDCKKIRCRPNTDALVEALQAGSVEQLARHMYNIFEDVLPPRFGAIGEIKTQMLSRGALGAIMTGTGSAVFGLFSDAEAAKAAHAVLRADYKDCFLASPVHGV